MADFGYLSLFIPGGDWVSPPGMNDERSPKIDHFSSAGSQNFPKRNENEFDSLKTFVFFEFPQQELLPERLFLNSGRA